MDQADRKLREQIRNDLLSRNSESVIRGIRKLANHGDSSLVPDLLVCYRDTEDEGIQAEIGGMLGSLKVSGFESAFIQALKDHSFGKHRAQLLSFMWNSGFNAPAELPTIVQVSLSGSFMQALEGMTLIESMEGPFEEEHVLESILFVSQYLERESPGQKREIANQMRNYLGELATRL